MATWLVFNPITFLFDVFGKFQDLYEVINEWIYEGIDVGTWTFSIWEVLGGGLFTVLILASLAKRLVPFL